MPVDPELVRRKASLILEDLERLRPLAEESLDAFLTSAVRVAACERLLERIIGRMIDVNYHLRTESGHAPPRDDHDSFVLLGELGVLPHERAVELSRAAGLRNRLAHEYDTVDPAQVHAAAGRALTDIREYLRAVEDFVARGEVTR